MKVSEDHVLSHRKHGYELLRGAGLEIGAFNVPACLPDDCSVEYCDVVTREEAIGFFPELCLEDLVEVDHICDLDMDGLNIFTESAFDFVILNHVIEHVANPIFVIDELFRICRPGGMVVVSAPDKDFTFDKNRDLTPFAHLLGEYNKETKYVSDEHYLDFLQGVHPEVMELSDEEFAACLKSVRARREHAHVWTSQSFEEFFLESLSLLGIEARCVFARSGSDTSIEYFSVWEKY